MDTSMDDYEDRPSSHQIQSVSSAYYDQAVIQPRTVGPNTTTPDEMELDDPRYLHDPYGPR